eukprot:jgi/Galph1/1579/GphlegSOOS_G256.1
MVTSCDKPTIGTQGKYNWEYVTYGSMMKLFHQSTGYRLHSHEVLYGTGSGQQSVTAYPLGGNNNSYWLIKGAPNESMSQGTMVLCGSTIRLEHVASRKNLHSHLPKSPISGNLEVSAFGKEGEGDSDKEWKRGAWIYLRHVDTNTYLSTSLKYVYSEPIEGHLEVSGIRRKNNDCLWSAHDGFYFL